MANKSTTHIRNLKFLLTEVCLHKQWTKLFQTIDCSYALRNPRMLACKHKSTLKYAIKKFTFKAPQI